MVAARKCCILKPQHHDRRRERRDVPEQPKAVHFLQNQRDTTDFSFSFSVLHMHKEDLFTFFSERHAAKRIKWMFRHFLDLTIQVEQKRRKKTNASEIRNSGCPFLFFLRYIFWKNQRKNIQMNNKKSQQLPRPSFVKAGSVTAASILWREQEAALHSLPVRPSGRPLFSPSTSLLPSLVPGHSACLGSAVELAFFFYTLFANSTSVSQSTVLHPFIISVESAASPARVRWRSSPAVGRDPRAATFLLPRPRARRFCPHQRREPPFRCRQTLWCSRRSSRYRCPSCCPHHLWCRE